jgi:hypothetical protein
LASALSSPLAFGQQRPPLPADFPKTQRDRQNYGRTPYKTITQCHFVAVEADLLLCSENGTPRSVSLASSCVVWKGKETSGFSGVKSGDLLDIRIRRDSDKADYIWVNIAKLEGEIRIVRENELFITPFSAADRLGLIEGKSVTVRITNASVLPSGFRADSSLAGRAAMVVGLRLEDGSINASTITLGR